MSWLKIAKKDFNDSLKSYTFLIINFIFSIGIVGAILLFRNLGENSASLMGLNLASSFASLVVPIVALASSYAIISGERDSGSIKILLSLPVTRKEVFIGKLVGRSLILLTSVLIAFSISLAVLSFLHSSIYLFELIAVFLATSILALVFVGIGTSISSISSTRGHAMSLALTFYLLLVLFWNSFTSIIHYFIEGDWPSTPHSDWFLLVQELSPASAYDLIVSVILEPSSVGLGSDSFSLTFGLLVLLFWFLFPPVIGFWRFRQADL